MITIYKKVLMQRSEQKPILMYDNNKKIIDLKWTKIFYFILKKFEWFQISSVVYYKVVLHTFVTN